VFKRIGIIAKQDEAAVRGALESALAVLARHDADVIVDANAASALDGRCRHGSDAEVVAGRDLIITVGGDGTLLRAAKLTFPGQVPLLGINLGRLGFLADISPQQVAAGLAAILGGSFVEEERSVLLCEIVRHGAIVAAQPALNDVVIQRWNTARLITLNTYVDGRFVHTQRSDGMIISTPTGSTAYALSGGGPILEPTVPAIVLVPICPHTLTNRPLVLRNSARVEIDVAAGDVGDSRVTADGNAMPGWLPGDRIRIVTHPSAVRLLHPAGHDHFATLRAKMQWGRSPC
jgi:NAD+ kinase